MFSHRPLDPGFGLTEIVGGVQQMIEFSRRQLGGHLRFVAEHRTQVTLFGHRAFAAAFEQMVCGIAADPLGEDDAHRFGEHQALGQIEVVRHAPGIHFQSLGDQQRLLQAARHQAANLRQGFPLGMPQSETALVFLGHGAEQCREQTGYTRRRADQHRRAHRIALVRHG
ncbi:hypothetical protein D3C71_1152770 [compost metagenome]